MKKYGSYQKNEWGGYTYRTEYIPSIKTYLEINVKIRPENAKQFIVKKTKRELNEIQRLKQKIRKLTDKLATAQMELDRVQQDKEYWYKKDIVKEKVIDDATKYVNKVLKKKCGKVLSEKDCDGMLDILNEIDENAPRMFHKNF